MFLLILFIISQFGHYMIILILFLRFCAIFMSAENAQNYYFNNFIKMNFLVYETILKRSTWIYIFPTTELPFFKMIIRWRRHDSQQLTRYNFCCCCEFVFLLPLTKTDTVLFCVCVVLINCIFMLVVFCPKVCFSFIFLIFFFCTPRRLRTCRSQKDQMRIFHLQLRKEVSLSLKTFRLQKRNNVVNFSQRKLFLSA